MVIFCPDGLAQQVAETVSVGALQPLPTNKGEASSSRRSAAGNIAGTFDSTQRAELASAPSVRLATQRILNTNASTSWTENINGALAFCDFALETGEDEPIKSLVALMIVTDARSRLVASPVSTAAPVLRAQPVQAGTK